MNGRRQQSGVALLVVLWACTLLAILLGGYAAVARTEAMQARHQFSETQAHYAAEAGISRAIAAMQDTRPDHRWVSDGRPYAFRFEGATVNVSLIDEGGKVDLNSGSPDIIKALFLAAGVDPQRAQDLAQAVVDWRSFPLSKDDLDRRGAAYRAAGLSYGPRGGPFASIEELQLVRGMDGDLYAMLAPQLTIWSGRESPDPLTAPPLALAALPGMDAQRIQQVRAARLNGSSGALALSAGVTHSIRSEATMADGTRAILRATVRLRGIRAGAQPFAVLRWQEGDAE